MDLSGFWIADDGTIYALQHVGDVVWWAGLNKDAGLQGEGLTFTNVFHGLVTQTSINGAWADVPRGVRMTSGILSLQIVLGADGAAIQLQTTSSNPPFAASRWDRTSGPEFDETGIADLFALIRKNQDDETLIHKDHSGNLKPYKDSAVIFGTLVPDDETGASSRISYDQMQGRGYRDFICGGDGEHDGDWHFDIRVDRAKIDEQPDFWTDGWEPHPPDDIRAKLDYQAQYHLHVEAVMFAGAAQCGDEAHYDDPPLLPGWQQPGGDSVLLNGRPIEGAIVIGDKADDHNSYVVSVLGRTISAGRRVRVIGTLVLDCGHGILRPCHEHDSDTQNQEIHPLYSIDVIEVAGSEDLTGAWADNNGNTYYLRQIGNVIWWLGLSPFRDRTFAQVFHGTLLRSGLNRYIVGVWQDVPLGTGNDHGGATVFVDPGFTTFFGRPDSSLAGRNWTKLYD